MIYDDTTMVNTNLAIKDDEEEEELNLKLRRRALARRKQKISFLPERRCHNSKERGRRERGWVLLSDWVVCLV